LIELKLEGAEPLLRKLDELGQGKYIDPILKLVGEDVRNAVAPYPPASEANFPRKGGWYERGYGPRWYGGRGGRKTSKKLSDQWFVRPEPRSVLVGVNAEVQYAPFVHGLQQAGFHARRGWKVLSTTAEMMLAREMEKVRRAVQRILAKR
jgi:hypothetical protein